MHLPYKWNRFAYNPRKIKGGIKRRKRHNGSGTPYNPRKIKGGIKRRKRHNGSGTPEARPWSFASLNTLGSASLMPFKIELFFCIFTECIKINKR